MDRYPTAYLYFLCRVISWNEYMKELCPRMLEPMYREPSNVLDTKNIELVRLCKQLVEAGGSPYFSCPDCMVTIRRKPITEKIPRF